MTFRQWEQVDTRGPIRASLLTLDLATTPGLAIDYAEPARRCSNRETVRRMIARDGAIAGINGDFYDIDDTGAPLGLGVDRERGAPARPQVRLEPRLPDQGRRPDDRQPPDARRRSSRSRG